MMPIFLWSMEQIQSRHSGPHRRNLVRPASITMPPRTTAMKVHSTMGSCAIGIESQVMRPNSQWAGVVCSDNISNLLANGPGAGLAPASGPSNSLLDGGLGEG